MSNQRQWNEFDAYISDRLVPPDPVLEAALEANAAAGLPPHDVSPTQGKLLELLVRIHGGRTVLELGTLGGYSTIWLGRALPSGGRLVTLESNPDYAAVAIENIDRAGLSDVVEVRVGAALETLPQLAAERFGPFDLIFIDADKANNPDYFSWAMRLSAPGSVILADNVVRDGAVLAAESDDPRVRGIRGFFDLASADPRVSSTAIQTVGVKGYDGFALVRVETGDADISSSTP